MAELSRGSSTSQSLSTGPYLAIITNHLDKSYMGALEVSILKKTTASLTQDTETHIVQYCSPFLGNTAARYEGNDSSNFGDVQKSYGFWAVPPDIGSTVMVIFIEGDPNQGYWFGCVQDRYQNFTMPGLAATQNVEITPEQETYFGTKLLPAGEFLKKTRLSGPDNDSRDVNSYNKPIHPFAERLVEQGLVLDTIRGVTSSSARREIPSSVFGMSTPGPLDKGGQTSSHIKNTSKQVPIPGTDPSAGMMYTSRLGGSTFVMDDGDADGQNELVRIRTRTGHQILLHNSQDLIYIANARGTAWLEFTSDGKVDIYAADSVSIHTEGDFNLRADRDFNLEAGRNIYMNAGNDFQSDIRGNWTINAMQKGLVTVGSTLDVNVVDTLKVTSTGQIHLKSQNQTYVTSGSDLHLNGEADTFVSAKGNLNMTAADWKVSASGSTNITSGHHIETAGTIDMNGPAAAGATASDTADTADAATDLPLNTLPNRSFDNGWANGKFYRAEDIVSIMKRVPTHEPWDQHESIDKEKFSLSATDATATPAPGAKSPVLPQDGKTTTQYKVAPSTSGTPPAKTGDVEQDNIAAFLWMIRNCEGTAGPTGYQSMFTGAIFDPNSPTVVATNSYVKQFEGQPNKAQGFKDHPGLAITAGVNGKGLTSTAAGAYQFLTTTWAACQKQLGLPDFSPASQDKACVLLLKRRGALDDVKAGRFSSAITKCNKEWASLPGSPYNQHPKDMQVALNFVKQGGGTIVA